MKRKDINPFDSMSNNDSKNNEQIIMTSGTIKSLEDFMDTIKEAVEMELGEDYEVSFHYIEEVNGDRQRGLFIDSFSNRPGPIFSMDLMFKEYLEGELLLQDVVSIILSEFKDAEKELSEMITQRIDCFEEIKDYIYPQLVNREKNKDINCIKIPFGDFMVIFDIHIMTKGSQIGSIIVNKGIFDSWGISINELVRTAYGNLQGEEMIVDSMEEDLKELEDLFPGSGNSLLKNGLYAVTKKEGLFGAVYMTNPDYLDEICRRTDAEAIYILPIATNVLIVLPDNGYLSKKDGILMNVIKSAIRDGIPQKYKLSDDVYKYDMNAKELVNVFDKKRRNLFE